MTGLAMDGMIEDRIKINNIHRMKKNSQVDTVNPVSHRN
jgi:hypothetical protein